MDDFFTISCSSLPDSTRVAAFTATEALSRPYEVKIYLLVPSDQLELSGVIGAKAQLFVDRATEEVPPFVFAGFLAAAEIMHEADNQTLLQAVLVPPLWELGLSRHSRMFTKMSLPEIIDSVFQEAGLTNDDYELRLGSYAKDDHVCQYGESDLSFISRWLEREGIYYYFDHSDSGAKMILCDDKSYADDAIGQPVRFHAQLGADMSAGASLRSFRSRQTTLPGTVKLRDYDYAKPSLDVSGSATVGSSSMAQVSVYGERFFTPGDGKRLAQIRAEELLAREIVFHATGTRLHLRPGYTFELEEHPRAAFNDEYLTISATHSGNQAVELTAFKDLMELPHDDVYLVELFAIPKKTQFRPERTTPWPRIYGNENGTVCGPSDSDYAQIDDQGRYNVKFKFDETALKDGKASTFVRMMQPHGGNPEGFHFPLRKGTEVIFTFLGGDPDRPVIAGVVNNAHNPSPVTINNYTQNVIMTGGQNHMIIEDIAGKQHIDIFSPTQNTTLFMGGPRQYSFGQAPAAQSTSCAETQVMSSLALITQGSGGLSVGGSWWESISVNYSKYVGGTAQIEYVGIHTLNCDADSNEWYNAHQNIVVATGRTDKVVAGGMTQDIHGGLTQTIEPGGSQVVTGGWLHQVTEQNKDDYDSWDTKVKDLWHAHIGEVTWTIDKDVTIECNKWECTQKGDVVWNMICNKTESTYGMTTEFMLGIKNEILIGGKNELTVASAKELFVGTKAEISVGSLMDIKIAAQVEGNIGPKIELKSAKAEKEETELKTAMANILKLGTQVTAADTSLIFKSPVVIFA